MLIAVLATTVAATQCTTSIEQGKVSGVENRYFPACRYLGIPFAMPPVGERRFAPPVPATPFPSGEFQAHEFGAGCLQVTCNLQHPEMTCPKTFSEDCLFLNVFTPKGTTESSSLPVMYWIHGGNYIYGAGGVDLYDGSRMASMHDVVIVSVNYRLGVFGGLYTTAQGSKGNFNLLDQRLGMKWVHENIKAFGGDPSRVTIFGQSAGAFSVASHLASPKSWPYFHAAIVESDPYALPTVNDNNTAVLIGDAIAKFLNCPESDEEEQRKCLLKATTKDILAAQHATRFPTSLSKFLYKPMPWTPVVESDKKNAEMPMTPLEAAVTGNFNQVPIMLGTVSNESVQFVWEVAPKPMTKLEYELFISALFGPKHAKALEDLYGPPPKNQTDKGDVRFFLSELATDYIFTCSSRWAAKGYAKKVDTYVYNFNHLLSYNNYLQNATDPECDDLVCHASELPILFNTEYLDTMKHPPPTDAEHSLSHQMQTVWSNFAKSVGDPNKPVPLPVQTGQPPLEFPLFDFDHDTVMSFDIPSQVVSNRRKKFCDYFDTIGYFREG